MTPRPRGTAARRLDEARLAVMLLTRLPVGTLRDPIPTLAQARWAYPLVGLPMGALAWAAAQGALALGAAPALAGLGALAALALATGGLHHDGLADMADGIGGGRDRTRRLAIMRDSRIGSYGALALILTVALGAAALAEIAAQLTLGAAMLVAVGSRLAMLAVLLALPPARPEGLGHGAGGGAGSGAGGTRAAWLAFVPGALACAALALTLSPGGLAVLGAIAGTALATGLAARRSLGGQTGDVLGAAQLATETAGWIALSLVLAAGA